MKSGEHIGDRPASVVPAGLDAASVRLSAAAGPPSQDSKDALTEVAFREAVGKLFDADAARVFRVMNRLSGDAELAADLTQEAFLRLNRRAALPERPEAWLITVAMNLLRNARSKRSRRLRLLTPARARAIHSDAPPAPDRAGHGEVRDRVRRALDQLPARDREILLLHAEGYRYREIAEALNLVESGIGTYLSRARKAFRDAWGGCDDAS
jgi:RNA polymerase sigma-70 factor (ECF subfamily)